MATITSQIEVDLTTLLDSFGSGFFLLLQETPTTREPDLAVYARRATELRGDNFVYTNDKLTDGVIESLAAKNGDANAVLMTDFSLPVPVIASFQNDPDLAIQLLFSGSDTILTSFGDDVLTGFDGADVMIGKDGDDRYEVDDTGDKVVESSGQGTDTVLATVDFRLTNSQFVEKVRLKGSDDIDANGNSSANTLIGNRGDNVLAGKAGDDSLTGGGGGDRFRFDTDLGNDRIRDFETGDRILLDQDLFDVLRTGKLASALFKDIGASGARVDAGDRILYNSDTGVLSYDVNGSVPGARALICRLSNKADLDAGDFLVVA